MSDVFAAWGYGLVETPVVEDLSALEAAAGSLEGTAFRLIDLDGRLLALRPDMTVPIARLVASRLSASEGPHRFRYAAEVFREHESLRGQSRQFTQVGVELVLSLIHISEPTRPY
jgi:ATP phosphoribosyltransferase regulatory subunit